MRKALQNARWMVVLEVNPAMCLVRQIFRYLIVISQRIVSEVTGTSDILRLLLPLAVLTERLDDMPTTICYMCSFMTKQIQNQISMTTGLPTNMVLIKTQTLAVTQRHSTCWPMTLPSA
jgi:hypothetical protein